MSGGNEWPSFSSSLSLTRLFSGVMRMGRGLLLEKELVVVVVVVKFVEFKGRGVEVVEVIVVVEFRGCEDDGRVVVLVVFVVVMVVKAEKEDKVEGAGKVAAAVDVGKAWLVLMKVARKRINWSLGG